MHARLGTYEKQTRPLLDYYASHGLLRVVDGNRETESIYRDIEQIVKGE